MPSLLNRSITALLLLSVLSSCSSILDTRSVETNVPRPDGVKAVWARQTFFFEYHASSVRYTCDALGQKLRSVLVALGAHQDLEIRARPCDPAAEVSRFEITMRSPKAASLKELEAYFRDDPKAELIARLHGQTIDANTLHQHRFDATWRTVSLGKLRSVALQQSDCELIRQMRDGVFGRFSLKIIQDLHCAPWSVAASRLRFTVSVLTSMWQ